LLLVTKPRVEVVVRGRTVFHFVDFRLLLSFNCSCFLLNLQQGFPIHNLLLRCNIFDVHRLEEVVQLLLLKFVILHFYPLVQPLRILNLWHRIKTVLQGCRDSHNFLDCPGKSILVVVPVEDAS
jgi:hypothetical protein